MTPLPKRRHSSNRSGKRERTTLSVSLPQASLCPKCKKTKQPHRICRFCNFY